ncbi:iron complex transport system permease protein [Meinhardsimonia xiamenensis]|jgi:iron complex transport system permease protein|uniref:Iron complex transport system permease protein n=1 Tax=Meinhardsimonia xiamenensis TaxID=990712 RepID=A0A1G9FPR7_9RHOB|nr:iron chelate uptake ABC transporter family permease subunit [Meinhardsimonia xiamenensis]PRX37741.1 iron complex transport system permease protein [Meinhardsimonia xiamenensis]SDK90406.1 iron complex transport system permease protein [Meinhardsimonia xiamenensis]
MAERRLLALCTLLALVASLFLLWNLRAPYAFLLTLRAEKLAALVTVGAATGAATIVFQTIAANRLLTPGIVGFDSLFVFIQTALVFTLGAAGHATLSPLPKFLGEALCLTIAATTLFGLLLRRGAGDMIRMLLTGVILGVLLRGMAGLAQRLLEPSEFAVVQQAVVASFNVVNGGPLGIAAVTLALALAALWHMGPVLDVAALGRDRARTLGLAHDRVVFTALALVAVLVSVSTALVGPVTFLGLLAASLAHAAVPDHRHRLLVPAAAMIGAALLVGGQALFERVLGLQSALAIVVEFAGGLLFLLLVPWRDAR